MIIIAEVFKTLHFCLSPIIKLKSLYSRYISQAEKSWDAGKPLAIRGHCLEGNKCVQGVNCLVKDEHLLTEPSQNTTQLEFLQMLWQSIVQK